MGGVHNLVERLERIVVLVEAALLRILVVVTFCLTLAQVVFRYLFGDPLVWSEELVLYFFVWITMVGAAGALRTNGHFALTTFVTNLQPKTAAIVGSIVDLAIATFAGVIFVQGAKMTFHGFHEEAVSFPVSMGWFYLSLPVGGSLMLWHIIARAIANRFGVPRPTD
jgi:TRAP-type C4-dicarboxylate transport system permease small subunit